MASVGMSMVVTPPACGGSVGRHVIPQQPDRSWAVAATWRPR